MANFSAQIKPPVLVKLSQISWRNWAIIGLLCLALGLSWQLIIFYQTAFYPKTFINGVAIGDKNLAETEKILLQNRPAPPNFNLSLRTETNFIASSAGQLKPTFNYETELNQIFQQNQSLPIWTKLKLLFGADQKNYNTKITLDPLETTNFISILAQQTDTPGLNPEISLETSGQTSAIKINPGKSGQKLKILETTLEITKAIDDFTSKLATPADWERVYGQAQKQEIKKLTVLAPVETSFSPLTENQINLAETAALSLVGKKLKLTINNQSFFWNDQQLVAFLNPDQTQAEKIRSDQILGELTKISQSLPSQPINAKFNFDPDTLKVTDFSPGKPGLKLETLPAEKNIQTAISAWISDEKSVTLLVEVPLTAKSLEPETNLEATNKLGIKELIGFGESYYAHSIPTRISNVALTAKKINLTIIKPGEEFSFNKTLGEVSAKTGFQPAYVIKSGRTELGDGGGVCQVSSTLFRSLLNAGLDITKRRPHSYRVTYYELNSDPGFDATVYAGDVDLRFINDTPGHILIYTETDSQKLWMKIEIYGTKDGRVATISDYKKWGASPPPPTEYIPDPSLPTGKKKQIDWSASGLKASFLYTVHDANGNLKQQETYTSVYRPWSAKYLVGI